MYDHCFDTIDDEIVKQRLRKKFDAVNSAMIEFRSEYVRFLQDNLENTNLDKLVRRKCDGVQGVLKIQHDPRDMYIPAHYVFYKLRKDGEICKNPSGSCGSLTSEIVLYYEPVID